MPIKTNLKKVIKDVKREQKKIARAQVRALNRAGRDTHPEAKRQLRRKYNVKSSTIQKAKQRPTKATTLRKRYQLEYRAYRVNVKDYGARQNRGGIVWQVQKGKKISLPHGFKVGHNSPRPAWRINKFGMIRTGRFKRPSVGAHAGKMREIIKAVTGPSVPQLLKTTGVSRRLHKFFVKKYKATLDKGIRGR